MLRSMATMTEPAAGERLRFREASPGAYKAMLELQRYVSRCGLEPSLLHLVTLRASQLNGCAFCIDMHWKEARAAGERDERLYAVAVWREAPFFSERERAALAWTEAVTLFGADHVGDAVYRQARAAFGDQELVDLTLAIVVINGWNRLCVAFRSPPGSL